MYFFLPKSYIFRCVSIDDQHYTSPIRLVTYANNQIVWLSPFYSSDQEFFNNYYSLIETKIPKYLIKNEL